MAGISRTVACLRFFGDELDPKELSRLLSGEPTEGCKKGDVLTGRSGRTRIARTGSWRLTALDREPGNLEEQIGEIFAALTDDEQVWLDLAERYQGDIFCGLFMSESNEGFELGAPTLAALGKRRITLSFDLYDPVREEAGSMPE